MRPGIGLSILRRMRDLTPGAWTSSVINGSDMLLIHPILLPIPLPVWRWSFRVTCYRVDGRQATQVAAEVPGYRDQDEYRLGNHAAVDRP